MDIFDKNFLSMCMLVSVGEQPEGRKNNEYYTMGGFIDFFNGDHRYCIRNCSATRKYLEARGYSYNSSTDYRIVKYTLYDCDDILQREGPGSYNYRKLMSYLISPARDMTWDKLDQMQSFDEIKKGIDWLFRNSPYLGPFKENEFLQTELGQDAIERYDTLVNKSRNSRK